MSQTTCKFVPKLDFVPLFDLKVVQVVQRGTNRKTQCLCGFMTHQGIIRTYVCTADFFKSGTELLYRNWIFMQVERSINISENAEIYGVFFMKRESYSLPFVPCADKRRLLSKALDCHRLLNREDGNSSLSLSGH